MTKESRTILIAGAGCSGLSLAMHLIEFAHLDVEVVLVEPRKRSDYTNDKTWSGFATKAHLFSGLASAKWDHWKCSNERGEHVSRSRQYWYEAVKASDYYDFCFDRLMADRRVVTHFGCHLGESSEGACEILGHGGELIETVTPDHFFDSRPQRDPFFSGSPDDLVLWQQFCGVEVEMEEDTFESGTATLMDFAIHQGGEIRFMYVLPFSKRRALLELTVFSRAIAPNDELRDDLDVYVKSLYRGKSWSAGRSESGKIPMATADFESIGSGDATKIGLSGGLMRPSTGYAFASIHEHSQRIARAIHSGRPIDQWRQGHISKALDRIFLSFLAKNPEQAGDLFLRISKRTDPDRFARFMMDTSSLLDKLSIIMSMPKLPFILEAWYSRKIWLLRKWRGQNAGRLHFNAEIRR